MRLKSRLKVGAGLTSRPWWLWVYPIRFTILRRPIHSRKTKTSPTTFNPLRLCGNAANTYRLLTTKEDTIAIPKLVLI